MDRSKWEYKLFEDCIEKSKKTKQLMTSDYQQEGTFPIISQEASLISGYTDDPDYVNHFDRPIVIFGDHTRVLKYVDFDFAVGADGVKILIPHTNLDAKFLLSFLTWYKIPNLGYSRHYKLLKEISVPVPPMEDQQRIVAEQDCLNEMIAVKQEQLKEFDKLAQSIFYDMFGDPTTNDREWELRKLDSLCTHIVDCPHSTPRKVDAITPYPCIRTSELKGGAVQWDTMQYLDEQEYEVRIKRLRPLSGDIVFGREGTIGDAVVLPDGYNFSLGQRTMLLRVDKVQITETFLHRTIMSEWVRRQIRMVNVSSTVAHVNIKDFKVFDIPVPPLSLQQQFADKISAIEAQKELVKQSIAETQALLDYTMDYYFNE